MSALLTLTTSDIEEIISSAALAEMDYSQKLEFCKDQSLPGSFIPDDKIFQNQNELLQRIAIQFGLESPLPAGRSLTELAALIFAETGGRPQHLTFFTSGSTGKPVAARSKYHDLEQEICSLAKLFANRKQIISYVPRHHIYGFLFSVLLPKALRIPVEFWPPMPGPKQVQRMRSGDLIIAFPLLWKKLEKLRCCFPENVYGVTSTGPCPPETIKNLCTLGLTRMTEVYGSSETGGIGYRHKPEDMYTLLGHWQQAGFSAIERTSADGSKQLYTLQDNLEWQGTINFRPIKRSDKAVQVGGINVYPARVEEVLKAHPAVRECSVRLMRPDEGERLKAFIVPDSKMENAALEKELRNLVIDKLSRHEKPGKYNFGPSLPTSDMGKLNDW
ncbi:AMP-binding enzyme [Maridesulfovibrio sp.]|uniref:AMP-binding enzyme n=1 Tax=Maridesulfovibrio sp. TaxID=2795000 RepID=UPI0039EE993E